MSREVVVAGASGVIGQALLPLLVNAGAPATVIHQQTDLPRYLDPSQMAQAVILIPTSAPPAAQ